MMTPSASSFRFTVCIGLLLLGLTHEASAQAVYRIVGPDGKVTYSDRPPQDAKSTATPAKQGKAGDSSNSNNANGGGTLPFALQQVVNKYPATLYTTKECDPCGLGRVLLTQRGIPFTEKTVNTREDQAAFKRISTDQSLPLLVLGGQQIKGYSEADWHSYLDAANYPKQSALPRGYQQAAAQPLVPLKTAADTPSTASDSPSNTTTRPTAPPPSSSNPAGIKF
jgi:glutaredoxin